MTSRVLCVSDQLWQEAAERLEDRVSELKFTLKCGTKVESGDGAELSPCSAHHWQTDVGTEHDQYTCYFRHWFKKTGSVLQCCKFSHLALMPLVRSCVWQALLAEFVSGKLCGRDAVRLRVEEELDHYSNLKDTRTRQKIGMLAQDYFGLVKNYLNSYDKPLNRAGIGGAERLVINLPGLDYRSARKGWSNRNRRKWLAQRIVDAGVGDLPTRKEQEAFVWKFLSTDSSLKETAPKSVLRLLLNYYDAETGEILIKPWSKEELSEIRKEAREKGTYEKTAARAAEIQSKLARGEKLTRPEQCFRSRNKDLFENLQKKVLQNKRQFVKEYNSYKLSFDMQQAKNKENPMKFQKNSTFPLSESYGERTLICKKEGKL